MTALLALSRGIRARARRWYHPAALRARRPTLFTGPFLRLVSFTFLAFFAGFQLFPVMPFRLLDLGSSRAGAGMFLAVYTWASALSAPFTGALADRFGRPRMLLFAAAAFAAFGALYGVVTAIPPLLAIAALHGVFWSGMLAASGALAIEAIPASRRTEGLGYAGLAPTAAVAVAPAVGLAIYRLGWWALAAELVALSLVLILLARRVKETAAAEPARAAPVEATAPSAAPAPSRGLAARLGAAVSWRVIAVASTIYLMALGYGGVQSYAALLAIERGVRPASLFFTAFALAVIASRVLVGPIADRRGPLVLLVPALLVVPVGYAMLAAARTAAATLGAAIVFAIGFGTAYPAFMTWILGRTDARRRGATFGSVLFALDTAIGTGSLLVGRVGERAGLGTAFLVMAGAAALALPAFLGTRRLLPADGG
jgi:MFS family permease